ncbi:MAG: SDR family NAD(P)-dependent oxidoreductase [Actinomycetota bacterium]|nr:SDR family NAD(P)-dependent oxidoreductase [Actinomycetota bacterium]
MDLQGKNVVVTGAGRGIGEALAREFNARGARVAVADLRGADAVAASLDGAIAFTADVSTEAGNKAIVEGAIEAMGHVDLFFANAGVGNGSDVLATPEDDWELAMNVNVHAHRWAARYLLPDWLERGDGYLPHPEVAGYMQMKAARPDRWLGGMRKLQRTVRGG